MMAWIFPKSTKNDLLNNRLCFYILLRATVLFLLVAASIGCYYFGSRYATQHGNLNDTVPAVYVANMPILGNSLNCLPNNKV